MALKEFWNGSVGPLLYDDEDIYEDGETLRGVRVDQILLDSAPSTAGEGIRQTATVTEDELEDAIAKKHTQNTDTALGAQSEDLDMNTHQVVALSVPDAAGEAIRQTEKITEVALEDAVDKKHASGSDDQDLSGFVEKVTGKSLVADTEIAKIHSSGGDTSLGAQSEDLNMNSHQVVSLSVPDAAGEAIRQTTKITEAALETVIDSGGGGQDIIDYRIETGKSVTIEAYQYLDIKLVEEYIIEGTGTLTINDNGFLNVGI